MSGKRHPVATFAFLGMLVHALPAFAQSAAETEPNDTPAAANAASLGGRVTGTLDNRGSGADDSWDYWVLNVTAGQTIDVDVDANEFGTYLDPSLVLYASDGTTVLASNGDWDGLDPYISYVATASGRYYVKIGGGLGGPMRYTINFTPVSCPVVEDGEPNDSRQTAHTITVGSSVRGVACPVNDQDFFKFRAEVGTTLELHVDLPRREPPLPSYGCACNIQAYVVLLASDSTVLDRTWYGDEPLIRYEVTKADTYYVQVWVELGGLRYAYTLYVRALDTRRPGPGDSIIVRAASGARPASGIVAAPDGVFYTSEWGRIWRVAASGSATELHDYGYALGYIYDLAFDAFGNLLIAADSGVHRISPGGTAVRLVVSPSARSIAVGPDGSFWVSYFGGNPGTPNRIVHYNPVGRELAPYNLATNDFPYHVVIGPSGVPYFSTGADIYRLIAGSPQHVLRSAHPGRGGDELGRFAFDSEGNIYAENLTEGTITLYDRSGVPLVDPFSWWPLAPTAVVFGRNADGTPSSRLFAIDGVRLIEMNPSGVRSPGLPLGRTTNITVAAAVKGLLRNAGLSDADRAFLAGLGNNNGRYDVGDLRAFLLATGELEGSVP